MRAPGETTRPTKASPIFTLRLHVDWIEQLNHDNFLASAKQPLDATPRTDQSEAFLFVEK